MATLPDWYQKIVNKNKEYLAQHEQAWIEKIREITGAADVTLDYQEPFLLVGCAFIIEGQEQVVRCVLDLSEGQEQVVRELGKFQSQAVEMIKQRWE